MRLKIFSILFTVLLLLTKPNESRFIGVNGGFGCATCTIIVGLVEQLAIVHNTTVEHAAEKFCNYLPSGFIRFTCHQVIQKFGGVLINGIYTKQSPDVICHALNFCRTDPGRAECSLFKKTKERNFLGAISHKVNELKIYLEKKRIRFPSFGTHICDEPIFKEICKFLGRSFKTHKPAQDFDDDGFSILETLRGTSWRGKDCNDFSSKIHPGTKPPKGDIFEDSNCNGIWGSNERGQSYEEILCKNTQPRGIAVLGDSVSAHFHVPQEWFDATKLNEGSFQHLAFAIENELDWPQFSATTGHKQSSWPIVQGNTTSLYLKLWERNKCNFRDYQNIAVNGADSGEMLSSIAKTLSRNQESDHPLIVMYSLVGNDVCNCYPDTFSNMTTPNALRENVIQTMQYLDTVLPNGSHVILTGLANGSVLYDLLSGRIHPIGRTKNDVTYSDVYNYLSCLELSPCNGWLSTNETIREMTTQYAQNLSKVIKNIAETYKFKNFDVIYYDFPLDSIMARWESMGGKPWELIEPVDGFHINQFAHQIVADEMWNYLLQNHPEWLGPINPYNDVITQLFGDQGGY